MAKYICTCGPQRTSIEADTAEDAKEAAILAFNPSERDKRILLTVVLAPASTKANLKFTRF